MIGCSGDPSGSGRDSEATGTAIPVPPSDAAVRPDPRDRDDWFTDRAEAAGLDFVHFNGMSGDYYFPEIIPAGVALLDYDNDGDLDAYFVQGQMMGTGKTFGDALFEPVGPLPLRGRLYRNDLEVADDGTRELRFTDVTDASGIDAQGHGMGVATGDVDNDGWIDLYLTNLGPNRLYRNNGDGTFLDASASSGVVAERAWARSWYFSGTSNNASVVRSLRWTRMKLTPASDAGLPNSASNVSRSAASCDCPAAGSMTTSTSAARATLSVFMTTTAFPGEPETGRVSS